MSNPSKALDNQQTSVSGSTSTATDNPVKPGRRGTRPCLLFGLLVLLIILLIVRNDLRHNAVESSENAVRYLAFDMLGWSPRDLFVWRLSLAGLMDSPLGQRWIGDVERASEQPLQVGDQYRASKAFTDDRLERSLMAVLERTQVALAATTCGYRAACCASAVRATTMPI